MTFAEKASRQAFPTSQQPYSTEMEFIMHYQQESNTRHHRKHQRGQGLIEYALVAALLSLVVFGGLALTGTSVGNTYREVIDSFQNNPQDTSQGQPTPAETPTTTPTPIPEDITVSVHKNNGDPVSGIAVIAFSGDGASTASAVTNTEGMVTFSGFDPGRYKFRADYSGQEFWSGTIAYPGQTSAAITISVRKISVHVTNARGLTLAGVAVHAYTNTGAYAGVSLTTDQNGTAVFTLPDGSYKFRADYKSQPYWSEVIVTTNTTSVTITIPEAPFTVRVTNRQGQPVGNVPVYAFNSDSTYAGISGNTSAEGTVVLNLPNGSYKFRADYDQQAYWSSVVTSPDVDSTTIQVGGTQVTVRVVTNAGVGLADMRVYAYLPDGSSAGKSAVTNAGGSATIELNDGSYKFRTDDQKVTYWSDTISVPKSTAATITVGSGRLNVQVVDQRGDAFPGIYVFAYRVEQSGNVTYGYYTGQYGITDSNGNVVLELDPDTYRILGYNYDYRNNNYHFRYEWSDYIDVPPTSAISLRIFR